MTAMAKQIYFEEQDEELQLCGQHALNNLLQGAYFTAFDLGDIGCKLDDEERTLYSPVDTDDDDDSASRQELQSYSNVSLYGGFSVEVLTAALKTLALDAMPLSHPQCVSAKDHPEDEEAFLVNLECHWMCYRKIHGVWYRMDSVPILSVDGQRVEAQPVKVSSDLLSSQIREIQSEHHQIYVIRGELPVDGQDAPKRDEVGHRWMDCDEIKTRSELVARSEREERARARSKEQRTESSSKRRANLKVQAQADGDHDGRPQSRRFEAGFHIKWSVEPLCRRSVNETLSLQHYECGSCRCRLRPNFLSKSNYFLCRYTGSMHCRQCHRGQRAVIPSRIVTALDVKPQSVCCAAKRYLDAMAAVPCIAISDFAEHRRVQKHKKMQRLKRTVLEMMAIESYLRHCQALQALVDGKFEGIRHGLLSMEQCVAVLSTDYLCDLEAFCERLKAHIINECDLCRWSGNRCVMR